MSVHKINGTYMRDGYIQDLAPTFLTIEIDYDGIWDVGGAYGYTELHVTDGEIRGWATVTFSPDPGELVRVGLLPPEMTVKAILEAALAKIEDPAHWTQGAYARDADGASVPVDDAKAVCWSSLGAIDAVTVNEYIPVYQRYLAIDYLHAFLPKGSIHEFKNHHDTAIATFRRAIAAAEAEAV